MLHGRVGQAEEIRARNPCLGHGQELHPFQETGRHPDAIPFDLIGELAGKTTVKQWIALYEKALMR
jgi:hypothetical protein